MGGEKKESVGKAGLLSIFFKVVVGGEYSCEREVEGGTYFIHSL